MTTRSTLDQKRTQVRLGQMRDGYRDWVQYIEMYQVSYQEFLEAVLTEELLGCQERHLRKRLKDATFPYDATLEQFDFTLLSELNRAVIMHFFKYSFIVQSVSLLLIGEFKLD